MSEQTFIKEFPRDVYALPFSDDTLIYDKKHHWYLINPNYIFNCLGEMPNNDQTKWKQIQFQLTDNLYRYIHKFKTGREDNDHLEYELATNQRFREVIAYCLLEQYQYADTSSGDIVHLQHGVDLTNDKTIPSDELRGDLIISDFAQDKLLQNGLLENSFRTNFDYAYYRVGY